MFIAFFLSLIEHDIFFHVSFICKTYSTAYNLLLLDPPDTFSCVGVVVGVSGAL